MLSKNALKLDDNDNVAVVFSDVKKGDVITVFPDLFNIEALDDIPAGHKVALKFIKEKDTVVKYGFPIGVATSDITKGKWVHTHNLKTSLTPEWKPVWRQVSALNKKLKVDLPQRHFKGYLRENNKAGVRNDLWVIPTVGCINKLLENFAKRYKKPGWVDSVKVLSHPYGCSQLGDDLKMTEDALVGLAQNPNACGVLVVGLGCENLRIDYLKKRLKDFKNIRFFVIQEEENEFERFCFLLNELAELSPKERTLLPISYLTIGVKCGGSDSFSGLTANLLLGKFSDYLTYYGGTVLISEIPEMFGAEDTIISRIKDKKVYDKFIDMVNWFRNYYIRHNQPIYENPSPGNLSGGITTLEEKSLGAVKKAGNNYIEDVLWYGEQFKKHGVNIVFGPGNDLVSSTSLVASGATIILFSTGRGTPFGSVVPTVKVSSNSKLYLLKRDWIDFDSGKIIEETVKTIFPKFVDFVIDVASGKYTCNEKKDIHEIAIFKDGVIL